MRTLLFLSLVISPSFALAANSAHSMLVRYASVSWNSNSNQIDTAYMFVRDKATGNVAKILLEETAPDSAQFEGQFSINWNSSQMQPEFFAPPAKLARTGNIAQFNKLLAKNKIKPLELFAHLEGHEMVYEIFDNHQQAEDAEQAYNQREAALKEQLQSKLIKPNADASAIRVSTELQQKLELARMAQNAADREAIRLRLQQLAQQKQQEQQLAMQRLAQQAQQKRKMKAAELAAQALKNYENGNYSAAVQEFKQAAELDPTNHEYYFQYGVSLYRINKLDDALVALKVAQVDPKTELQKQYYIGLIYYKTQDLQRAEAAFIKVKAANDPSLSPPAAFYLGLIYTAEDKLKSARDNFEYVLDNSKNQPLMDKRADDYLDKIAERMAVERIAAKKWSVDASESLIYDSDILLQSNNGSASTGHPSNQGGGRNDVNLAVVRQLHYSDSLESSVVVNGNYMWSFDSKFAAGDPTDLSLNIPIAWKGTWRTKRYKFTVTPGYETIDMDYNNLTGGSSRPDIFNSYLTSADMLLVMQPDWFQDTTFNFRKDDSLLPDGGPDNSSATQWGIKQTETVFLDASKKKALLGYLSYIDNNAAGSNYRYNQLGFGVAFTAPLINYQNASWSAAITTYHMVYPDKNTGTQSSETDDDTTFSAALTKMVNTRWSWVTSAAYTTNPSNVAASSYDKYIVMGTVNYHWDDAPKDNGN